MKQTRGRREPTKKHTRKGGDRRRRRRTFKRRPQQNGGQHTRKIRGGNVDGWIARRKAELANKYGPYGPMIHDLPSRIAMRNYQLDRRRQRPHIPHYYPYHNGYYEPNVRSWGSSLDTNPTQERDNITYEIVPHPTLRDFRPLRNDRDFRDLRTLRDDRALRDDTVHHGYPVIYHVETPTSPQSPLSMESLQPTALSPFDVVHAETDHVPMANVIFSQRIRKN